MWAEAAVLIVVVLSVAAVLITAMLSGWKPWDRPSIWERIHARADAPRDQPPRHVE